MVENLRQFIEIDPITGENDLFYRRFGNHFRRNRFFHRAQISALHFLRLGVDCRRQSRAAGMKIGQDGKRRAFYFFEKQNRPPLGFLFELHRDRGDFKSRIDFAGDGKEVFRMILFD